jgi:hypothetical protein
MATREPVHMPMLGEHGEPCARCGSALADDQRYCLECGLRRADARVAFMDVLGAPGVAARGAPPVGPTVPVAPAALASRPAGQAITPGMAAVGVGLAVLFLGVGVLVGRSGDNSGSGKAQAPQVVTVGGAAPAAASTASAAKFTSDWPDGQTGFTIQLQTLPKSGTDVAAVTAAKAAATGKGAKDVGALDSDSFPSLSGGNYVVYSGVFKTKALATKALKSLRAKFPGAKVVQVSAGGGSADSGSGVVKADASTKAAQKQLDALKNLSGADYSKKAAKLPNKIAIPGKAPAKDNKQGGGGSGFQTIG